MGLLEAEAVHAERARSSNTRRRRSGVGSGVERAGANACHRTSRGTRRTASRAPDRIGSAPRARGPAGRWEVRAGRAGSQRVTRSPRTWGCGGASTGGLPVRGSSHSLPRPSPPLPWHMPRRLPLLAAARWPMHVATPSTAAGEANVGARDGDSAGRRPAAPAPRPVRARRDTTRISLAVPEAGVTGGRDLVRGSES